MPAGLSDSSYGIKFTETDRGISATTVYNYSYTGAETDRGFILPKLGDTFVWPEPIPSSPMFTTAGYSNAVNSYAGLICRQRDFETINGSPTQYRWTCTFLNEVIDTQIFRKSSEDYLATPFTGLSKTMEYSGEFTTVTPSLDAKSILTDWVWNSDNTQSVAQPLPFKVNKQTLRVKRYIPDSKIIHFMQSNDLICGKVNYFANPFGYGDALGCWLYTGATTNILANQNDDIFWEAELTFEYRNPDTSQKHGWNKLIKRDGSWDIPIYTPTGNSLYIYTGFLALFDDTVDAFDAAALPGIQPTDFN
jgi:hypothetical protein